MIESETRSYDEVCAAHRWQVPDRYNIAQDVGFKLVATSEVNATPKDDRDHPKGVWTLPPSLRLKDKDREAYLAIGESDRMTVKFIKPKE